jgi:hypothetical protein
MPPPKASLRNRLAGQAARFRTALAETRAVQARRLQAILARHQHCEYGRRHGFASIADPAAYAQRVPVVDYDALRGSIERMAAGARDVLVATPVIAFEETGGSSGGAKLVPYTAAALASFQRGLLPWLDDLHANVRGLDAGRAYWSISPAARAPRQTAGGIPVGLPSDAAYLGEDVAGDLLATLCVPPAAARIADVDAWRRFTLAHLLAAENLALISIWSPTFLQELLRHAQEDAAWLVRCLVDGDPGLDATGAGVPAPRVSRARGERMRAVLAQRDPEWTRLWPDLAVISCWDQAAAAPYAAALRRAFPGVHVQGKGLLATEGLVTVPLCDAAMPVLAVDSGFYEFVDAGGTAWLASDVIPGQEYEVLLTNDSGFYRYAIGDRVRVHGFVGSAPMLEFVGRAGGGSDLCGEKLTEAFVGAALFALGLRFAMLAPVATAPRGYVLLLDAAEVGADDVARLAARTEAALAANPQYAYARKLAQLAPVRGRRCDQPMARWLALCRQRGQRLGDIKPVALCTVDGWQQHFAPCA